MKIGKYHIDWIKDQYYVYTRTQADKRTKVETPQDTSYFSSLAGALKFVRHELIGKEIGKGKEDDLAKVVKYITDVDKYFVKCLNVISKEQERLTEKMDREPKVECEVQVNEETDVKP